MCQVAAIGEVAEDSDVTDDGETHGSSQSDDDVIDVSDTFGMGLATVLGAFGVDHHEPA